jgi:hypothetical protein
MANRHCSRITISSQIFYAGRVKERGVVAPEGAFQPLALAVEPSRRGIKVHERIEEYHSVT